MDRYLAEQKPQTHEFRKLPALAVESSQHSRPISASPNRLKVGRDSVEELHLGTDSLPRPTSGVRRALSPGLVSSPHTSRPASAASQYDDSTLPFRERPETAKRLFLPRNPRHKPNSLDCSLDLQAFSPLPPPPAPHVSTVSSPAALPLPLWCASASYVEDSTQLSRPATGRSRWDSRVALPFNQQARAQVLEAEAAQSLIPPSMSYYWLHCYRFSHHVNHVTSSYCSSYSFGTASSRARKCQFPISRRCPAC